MKEVTKAKTRTALSLAPLSLMSPDGRTAPGTAVSPWEADLELNAVVRALALDKRYASFVRQILIALTADAEVIAWRQATLRDFLNHPALVDKIQAFLPRLASLLLGNPLLGQRQRNLLLETSDRLAELDLYVTLVRELHDALSGVSLQSTALLQLRDSLSGLLNDPMYIELSRDLPELRAPLERIASITIGINLDTDLKPISAALLAINNQTISEPLSFLERLIGIDREGDDSGIAPLRHLPNNRDERALQPLFQDLDRLLTQTAQPVARALNRYVRINSESLAALEFELAYFVGAARLFRRLPYYCVPEIAPPDERVTLITDLASLHLLLASGAPPVASAADFDDAGRIAILTGPNSGGKTTYLRSVGIAQVLFQAGLAIPAHAARISPVDSILTHFPALETGQGRLAEEAARLRAVFEQASNHSLVLLNETFSSTAPGEALYLAQDVLCGLRAIGVRAIYATHLVDLADHLDEIEQTVTGTSAVFCLIAAVQLNGDGQAVRTYRIERGRPFGRSYAQEIARQHGISLEQILRARS